MLFDVNRNPVRTFAAESGEFQKGVHHGVDVVRTFVRQNAKLVQVALRALNVNETRKQSLVFSCVGLLKELIVRDVMEHLRVVEGECSRASLLPSLDLPKRCLLHELYRAI